MQNVKGQRSEKLTTDFLPESIRLEDLTLCLNFPGCVYGKFMVCPTHTLQHKTPHMHTFPIHATLQNTPKINCIFLDP